MNEDSGESWRFSLQQRALHELAKMCWGKFELKEASNLETSRYLFKDVITHRNEIINKIPEILSYFSDIRSVGIPKYFTEKITLAVAHLERGYSEAIAWEENFKSSLPFKIFNTETAGEYHASCFIDPSGHFDDLAWSKRFVADKNQFIQTRFEFACFYCFEEDITNLWCTMKNNRQLPCKGKLKNIKSAYKYLVYLWALKLKHTFDELEDSDRDDYREHPEELDPEYFYNNFFITGLRTSIFHECEYAVKFFWPICSEEEKKLDIYDDVLVRLFSIALTYKFRLLHFIYSQLSLEEKAEYLFVSHINYSNVATVWACLLQSPYYESVLDDILAFPKPISSPIYEIILSSLCCSLNEPGLPNLTVFQILWKHLSVKQRTEVVSKSDDIINNLIEEDAIDVLEIIIQPLSHFEKDRMLLDDWKNGGISSLEHFFKVGNSETMHRYLLCFLIDFDSETQSRTLRVDASEILVRFTEKMSTYLTDERVSEVVKKEHLEIIERLLGSLNVLEHIFGKMETLNTNCIC